MEWMKTFWCAQLFERRVDVEKSGVTGPREVGLQGARGGAGRVGMSSFGPYFRRKIKTATKNRGFPVELITAASAWQSPLKCCEYGLLVGAS
jgi:hypothetical protein